MAAMRVELHSYKRDTFGDDGKSGRPLRDPQRSHRDPVQEQQIITVYFFIECVLWQAFRDVEYLLAA